MPQLTSMKISEPLPKIIDLFCMAIGTWSHDHMMHPFINQALLIDHHITKSANSMPTLYYTYQYIVQKCVCFLEMLVM